jgi:serine protease Do
LAGVGGDDGAAGGPSIGQKLALYTKPAVVRIISGWQYQFQLGKQPVSGMFGASGSGFFISPDGYIATNAHVVQSIREGKEKAISAVKAMYYEKFLKGGVKPAQALMVARDLEVSVGPVAYVVLPNGEHANYDIKEYGAPIGEGKDCAVIKINCRNAPTLVIGDSQKVQVEDRIYVVGYPGVADVEGILDEKSQLEASITDGTVSAIKNTSTGDQVIQVSAPITHGNSGGPAVNSNGEVIGLATFGNDKEVQGFNFLVSSSTLAEFVRQAGASNIGSETDAAWRTALDLFWARRYTAAIDQLQEVENLFPAHTEAHRTLDEARELKRQGKERWPFTFWVLMAGGPAALCGGLVFVRRRKRLYPAPVQVESTRPSKSAPVPLEGTGPVRPNVEPVRPMAATVFATGRVGTLTATRGQLSGQRFTLTPEGILIGRQPGIAHVVVNDGRASAQHCWIRWEGNSLIATDQGTTNGTFVNDPKRGRISRAELKDGDVVIIADPDCCSLLVKLS